MYIVKSDVRRRVIILLHTHTLHTNQRQSQYDLMMGKYQKKRKNYSPKVKNHNEKKLIIIQTRNDIPKPKKKTKSIYAKSNIYYKKRYWFMHDMKNTSMIHCGIFGIFFLFYSARQIVRCDKCLFMGILCMQKWFIIIMVISSDSRQR